MTEPLVSVIVPSYRGAGTIGRCLTALVSQRTGATYDVTVVDSSDDETAAIVREAFPSVRLVHSDRRLFAGAARNRGADETRSRYCLMVDADCVAEPDLLERMLARHREGRYAAVAGALRNGTPASVSGTIGYLMEFKEFMETAPCRLATNVPTAAIMYRRETFERFERFDPDMWLGEDILFHWKMTSAGERILFDPAIRVTHLNRTGWGEMLRYQIALGRMSAEARRRGGLPGQVLLRHPSLASLMPFARTWRAFQWLGRHDRRMLLRFVPVSPLYVLASGFWSYGFHAEASQARDDERGAAVPQPVASELMERRAVGSPRR